MSYNIYFDGSSIGNPGPAGCGWEIYKDEVCVKRGSKHLGNETNNYAEYYGMYYGLYEMLNFNTHDCKINVYGDSKLVIEQLKKNWQCKSKKLEFIRNTTLDLIKKMQWNVNFEWIPRDKNSNCDELAKNATKSKLM